MMKKRISEIRKGGVLLYSSRKGIVTERFPEDQVSGMSRVTFDDGHTSSFVWDQEDPLVIYLGQGKMSINIEVIQGSQG